MCVKYCLLENIHQEYDIYKKKNMVKMPEEFSSADIP